MTEETGEEIAALDVPPEAHDWWLETLVGLANGHNGEIGVTVSAGGLLISGFVASGEQYFEEFAADVANSTDGSDEDREALRKAFAQPAERYRGGEPIQIAYVHIRDARFYTPGNNGLPTNRGVWWRGRLSQIDGWNLGVLSDG